jgi:hypothetical protein
MADHPATKAILEAARRLFYAFDSLRSLADSSLPADDAPIATIDDLMHRLEGLPANWTFELITPAGMGGFSRHPIVALLADRPGNQDDGRLVICVGDKAGSVTVAELTVFHLVRQ